MPMTPIVFDSWIHDKKVNDAELHLQHKKIGRFFHSVVLIAVTEMAGGMLFYNNLKGHQIRHPQLKFYSIKRVIPCSMSFVLINYILVRNLKHIWFGHDMIEELNKVKK